MEKLSNCVVRAGKPVADPGFRQDVLWLGRIGFDLFSKVGDEDAQVVGLIAIVRAPYRLKQFSMRNRFPALGDEIAEKIKFLRCEAYVLLAGSNPACFEVDFQIVGGKCFRAARMRARTSCLPKGFVT